MIYPTSEPLTALDTQPLPLPVAPDRAGATGPGTPVGRHGQHRSPRRRRRWLRRLAIVVIIGAVVVGVSLAAIIGLTPSVGDAQQRTNAILALHHAPSDQGVVPAKVATALLATEDSRFYHEGAFDPRGVARAVWGFVTRNHNAGGATITQQLAKLLYTPNHSDLFSELEQVGVAIKLDHHFSKQQILAMYFDAAYFGDGAYGVTEAAQHYFGVPTAQLSWAQASLLAGLVQAPSAYDPHTHFSLARLRQRHVLARLVATHALTAAEAAAAASAPLAPAISFSG